MAAFTEAEDAQIREWHAEGLTGAEMAIRLGRSRCSVVARWNRMGLSDTSPRSRTPKSRAAPFRGKKSAKPEIVRLPVEPYVEPVLPRPETQIGLLDLTHRTCRYPYGDPKDKDFAFCGSTDGVLNPVMPYCRHHAAMAYHKV